MDLLDVWRGRMSWRRLGVLIRHLPPESATATAVRDKHPDLVADAAPEGDGPWSHTDMILALVRDELQALRWRYETVHLKQPPKPPEPMQRPGVRRAPSGPDPAAIAYLEGVRARHLRAVEGG